MKTVNDIRSAFLSYFQNQGHEIVRSGPLVPQNDPSVMFVMAGMMPFKDIFTGKEKRDYTRAVSSQKCIRAGGKHNDLENVGYTARHHTFFEMLGNFSFGDYFKEEAIAFSWELVTKVYGLPKDKLLVTIYHTDDEAAAIWKKVSGLSDDRILRIATSDNFWSMGDTGPCGPCSEIFYDHGEHIPGGPPGSPDEDGDRFIEIWNLVFMQYEQLADGTRIDLPSQSIDTGMGLERLSAILQGVHSNYEIDVFQRIMAHISDLTGQAECASHRVIADHLRASAFLIADGVLPSNEGRGYVLRRIMRRGMRHAHILGAQDPLMYKLIPTLNGLMGEAYPELTRANALITETLKNEEAKFRTTLSRGLKLLDEASGDLGAGDQLAGETAFKLYDTYGFPVDLTADALKARNISVDMNGFDAAMQRQKEEARKSWAGSGASADDKIWFDILDRHGATEFLGYELEQAEGQVVALLKKQYCHPVGERQASLNKRDPEKDGSIAADTSGSPLSQSADADRGDDSFEWVIVDALAQGENGIILTNQTPFYGESGGQVGDTGLISNDAFEFDVSDTKKPLGKLFAHYGAVKSGAVKVNDPVHLKVNSTRRSAIRANHSATHLLHKALHEVLGDHVAQKGSLQDHERTRFDISHPKGVAADEIVQIEALVNAEIQANTPVETRVMNIDDAIQSGATALFGEKYDDEVRVVSMGTGDNQQWSVELCGGTHVKRTGDIGLFKIVSESAVSSGVRRIEALTGQNALNWYEAQDKRLKETAHLLKAAPADVLSRVQALLDERKKLESEIAALRQKLATGGTSGGPEIKEINGIKFSGQVLDGVPAKDLKSMADALKAKLGSGVVVLIANNDGKASIVVGVTDDLTGQYSAVDLVRIGSEALGGKGGGGRPDMAQAGGPDASAANDAVAAIERSFVG